MKRYFLSFLTLLTLFFLTACGGTLSVGFDITQTPGVDASATALPVPTAAAQVQATQPPALAQSSDSETIRRAMLNSHNRWQTLWVDARVDWYSELSPVMTQSFRQQVWVDRLTSQFRTLVGDPSGAPQRLQVSTGTDLMSMDFTSGETQPSALPAFAIDPAWEAPQAVTDTIRPYPLGMVMDAPVRDMLFSTALAQRGGTYTAESLDQVAGREVLVVDWTRDTLHDRFWLDTATGVPLRWQSFMKGQSQGASARMASEMTVTAVQFDQPLKTGLFTLNVKERPQFALNAAGDTTPTQAPPTAASSADLDSLFFVINRSPEALQLVSLPGACVTGSEACPAPQPVKDYPNQNNTIEPLIWSPDRSMALLVQQGRLYRYNPAAGEWKTLAQFPVVLGPVWSADSAWIAFIAQDGSDQQNLYVIRSSGADLHNLTNGQFQQDQTFLWVDGWLADGRVLFTVTRKVTGELYAMKLGDTQATRLLEGSIQRGVISLSPDQKQIAYSAAADDGVTVSMVAVEGGPSRRIATFQHAAVQQILWSPGWYQDDRGPWIALLINSGSSEQSTVSTVYVLRPDGTDLRQLYQERSIGRLIFAGDGLHLIAEGTVNGRLTVIPLETGTSHILEAPGLRLDQSLQGISWR